MPLVVNSQTLKNWAGFVLALFILNFALTFHNVWPTLAITTRYELSVEIAVLILTLALYLRFVRPVPPRMLTVFALVLTVMTIARYVEVTAPALYGRRVNLYWDAQYLPHVAEMLVKVANPLWVALIGTVGLLGLAVIYKILRLALVRVNNGFNNPLERRIVVPLMIILITGYTIGHINQPIHTLKYYSLPITKTYWEQVEFVTSVIANEADDVLPASDPLGDFDLPRLGGADVIVQFMESYGATAYDNPVIAESIAESREVFAGTIAATNRRVVSAFVKSPTFGGNSWLAHSSFMTGLDIRHLATYDLLMTQDRKTLSDRFDALGYKPVALMPGLRTEWPEGVFFGFEKIYGAKELDYRGPEFGWWRIPDQYSLARLAEQELERTAREPVFLFFTTITSHMPFRPTPPYQPDWSRILTGDPFDQAAVKQSLALRPEWTNLQPSYAGTLNYMFQYLGGFLHAQEGQDFIWVIIGDHQPPASVSGEGVRWDVPVHIVSSNDAIIETLLQKGFVEGLTPADEPIGDLYTLPAALLAAFAE